MYSLRLQDQPASFPAYLASSAACDILVVGGPDDGVALASQALERKARLLDYRSSGNGYLPQLEFAAHVHLPVAPWARELFDDIDQLGLTVSTNLHDWDGHAPSHHEFAYRSDIVFVSTARLEGRVEATMREILARGRASIVVALAGAEGSFAIERADGRMVRMRCGGLEEPLVDSPGARDAYVAAFLAGHAQGMPLRHCMRMGAIGGEYAAALDGTPDGFMSRAQLRRFLAAD